jgi:hypothetical protein
MTTPDLLPVIAQYRAGLDAEMALLHRLEMLSERQREATTSHDVAALERVTDQRGRVMANLVAIEHELRPIRLMLLEHREALRGNTEFEEVAALHKEAAALVTAIVSSDRESLGALKEAELARRFAARAVEQGESTLAAYRRVVLPPLAGATLVNRKG